jgi:OmpA-OmpF porin, OOP family
MPVEPPPAPPPQAAEPAPPPPLPAEEEAPRAPRDEPLPPPATREEAPAPAPALGEPVVAPKTVKHYEWQSESLFAFDKADLTPAGKTAIDQKIAEYGPVDTIDGVIVTGHADRIGKPAYNQRLSERRAAAVKQYLLSKGISDARITTSGKGSTEPVTGDKCKKLGPATYKNKKLVQCLAPDRRVEIDVKGKTEQ